MKLFTIVITIVMLSSCKILDHTTDNQDLGNTRWLLTAIEQRPTTADSAKFIQFDTKEQEVTGKAACNGFSAEYELFTNNRISFAEIGSTKMYCDGKMDDEMQIITNLGLVKRFEIKSDRLFLFGDKGLLLTYKR